jgi:hypothetical protein
MNECIYIIKRYDATCYEHNNPVIVGYTTTEAQARAAVKRLTTHTAVYDYEPLKSITEL